MIAYITNKIKAYVIRKATANKLIDIVEVRTKEIGLTSVKTETDIRITNTFFLSITVLSIKTDLLNRDGLKIGRMTYEEPQRIHGKSEEILKTTSEISIITSIFQAISTLLSQHIIMRSVGVAQIKFLWWIFEVPVDDYFEIHPSKLKITQPETEEQRVERLRKEAEWKEKYAIESERRKTERELNRAERKEDSLKRRYKENYVPKEQRDAMKEEQPETAEVSIPIDNEAIHHLTIELDAANLSNIETVTDSGNENTTDSNDETAGNS